MQGNSLILLFAGMFVVTYIPRALPVTILSKFKLPQFVLDMLEYIPIAILGALLVPSLLLSDGVINISFDNHYLITGILSFIFGIFCKKLYAVVVFGIVVMAILINFF